MRLSVLPASSVQVLSSQLTRNEAASSVMMDSTVQRERTSAFSAHLATFATQKLELWEGGDSVTREESCKTLGPVQRAITANLELQSPPLALEAPINQRRRNLMSLLAKHAPMASTRTILAKKAASSAMVPPTQYLRLPLVSVSVGTEFTSPRLASASVNQALSRPMVLVLSKTLMSTALRRFISDARLTKTTTRTASVEMKMDAPTSVAAPSLWLTSTRTLAFARATQPSMPRRSAMASASRNCLN